MSSEGLRFPARDRVFRNYNIAALLAERSCQLIGGSSSTEGRCMGLRTSKWKEER